MRAPIPTARLEYLSEYSTTDSRWDTRRSLSQTIAGYYKQAGQEKYATRIDNCANRLGFAIAVDEDGNGRLKINSVHLCHHRQCQVCQAARARVWARRFYEGLPKLIDDNPTVRFLFLTLTVKNCPIQELRGQLQLMSQAFTRLVDRAAIKRVLVGYIRSTEITKSDTGEAHPHFHVLLAVKASYFRGDAYIKQDEWATMWQESLRVDYTPVTDIRVVKPKDKQAKGRDAVMTAIRETAKYTVKGTDLVGKGTKADRDWMLELTKQVHATKQVNLSGLFRTYIKDDEPEEDEILKANPDDEDEKLEEPMLFFNWFRQIKRYARYESD